MVQMRLGLVTTEQCLADSQADDDRDDEPDLVRPKKARKKYHLRIRFHAWEESTGRRKERRGDVHDDEHEGELER